VFWNVSIDDLDSVGRINVTTNHCCMLVRFAKTVVSEASVAGSGAGAGANAGAGAGEGVLVLMLVKVMVPMLVLVLLTLLRWWIGSVPTGHSEPG
jgi:hypothetical protein